MYKFVSHMIFLVTVLSLSACSVLQPKTDEERVFYLAEKRQAALLKHDFDKAYTFMSPGYREVNSIPRFTADNQGAYSLVSTEVDKVICEDDACKVYVKIEFDARVLMGSMGRPSAETMVLPRVNRETWVRLDNKWWFSRSE